MGKGGFDFWNPRRQRGLDILPRPNTEDVIDLPRVMREGRHPVSSPKELGKKMWP